MLLAAYGIKKEFLVNTLYQIIAESTVKVKDVGGNLC